MLKITKTLPKELNNVLADPSTNPNLKPGSGRIYLGDGTKTPNSPERYPICLPTELLDMHVLIAGSIGSGKTSLLLRIISGAIKHYGTVVIGEAKAGAGGGADGAAFTDLARYLANRFPELNLHRWPRGNCFFNPLLYLTSLTDLRAFLDALMNQIQAHSPMGGDMAAYLGNALGIAEQIILYLQQFSITEDLSESCTLRRLVKFLRRPAELAAEMEEFMSGDQGIEILQEIQHRLQMSNYFYLEKEDFAMTRHGVNTLCNILEQDDLLYYSEPQEDLSELTIDDLLYQRSLVIISQPLHDPASRVVGPLFWDSLLAKVIQLGPNSRDRQKVLVVLDETHRLPVGRLGESGDFLREYGVGLVEITPTIIDMRRWQQNQHVYQTIISLTPGVPAVVELLRSKLPNLAPKQAYMDTRIDGKGQVNSGVQFAQNYQYQLSQDNPGASARTLQVTGRYTALLQCVHLDGEGKVFWLDMESDDLANMKQLLQQAIEQDFPLDLVQVIDRALGL